MKHQLDSFRVAIRGIWYSIKSESHMRFHIIAGTYVIIFSFFFQLSKTQWAVILFLIASILAAEIFNTCIEEICNLNTQSYDPMVRIAKDVAAGAVLVLSILAVAVAFIFYFDLEIINKIVWFFLSRPALLTLFILSLIISAVFIFAGPMGISKLYHKLKAKK